MSVTIPYYITSIGNSAFAGCTNLTSAYFMGNTAPTMGSNVFSLTASDFTVYFFNSASGFGLPTWLGYPAVNITYTTAYNQASITSASGSCSALIIPSTIFSYPVISIGGSAFSGCNGLTSVTIPSSVTSIGDSAFACCACLTSITVDAQNANYASLDGILFDNNKTTLIQYPGGKTDSSYTLPSSVTGIGSSAFNSCASLTNVTIPNSVTNIGSQAFSGCINLKSAVFKGNAPTSVGSGIFFSTASGFTVDFYNGATGFTSPWNGYTTANMGPSPVSSWLLLKGLPHDADLQSAPNGDGVPLLLKYALNLEPTRNECGRIPQPVVAGNQVSLTYYAGNPGITYSVEASADLKTWSTEGVTLSGPDANNNYTATVPANGPQRFLRLVVVH